VHVAVHWLATQLEPAAHAVAHAPQLLVSVVRSVQVPLQFVIPVPHEATQTPVAQIPLWQVVPDLQKLPFGDPAAQAPPVHACAFAHALPQLPQLDGSEDVVTQ
jgi:hypothetical protein